MKCYFYRDERAEKMNHDSEQNTEARKYKKSKK